MDAEYQSKRDAEETCKGMAAAWGSEGLTFDVVEFNPNIVIEKIPVDVPRPMTIPEMRDFLKKKALRGWLEARSWLSEKIDPEPWFYGYRSRKESGEDPWGDEW